MTSKKASIYAFLITSAHNSVYPRGAGFNGYKKDKDRLKLEVLIDKLKKNKYTDKLKSIKEFNNIDFEELINKYDSEDTYLYLDPPYHRLMQMVMTILKDYLGMELIKKEFLDLLLIEDY